jgi:hypothetical protein
LRAVELESLDFVPGCALIGDRTADDVAGQMRFVIARSIGCEPPVSLPRPIGFRQPEISIARFEYVNKSKVGLRGTLVDSPRCHFPVRERKLQILIAGIKPAEAMKRCQHVMPRYGKPCPEFLLALADFDPVVSVSHFAS